MRLALLHCTAWQWRWNGCDALMADGGGGWLTVGTYSVTGEGAKGRVHMFGFGRYWRLLACGRTDKQASSYEVIRVCRGLRYR